MLWDRIFYQYVVCPERAAYDSPGQRPGEWNNVMYTALKGRLHPADNAPFQGFGTKGVLLPQGVALGYNNMPFQGNASPQLPLRSLKSKALGRGMFASVPKPS